MSRRNVRRGLARLGDALLYASLKTVKFVVGLMPRAFIDPFSTAVGFLLYVFGRRGRRIALQNLDVVFGDTKTRSEKRRIFRASLRESVRAVVVVLHAAPLTPERFRRWVDVPPEVEQLLRVEGERAAGAVIVSAHVGNWEILLGLSQLFTDVMPVMFLVEASFSPAVNRFLAEVRGTGGGASTSRKGGARTLVGHVRRGGAAGVIVDRNVRQTKGGVWAPFFGLSALTTPLPATLARGHGVPLVPVFCLPTEDGRYRIRVGEECARDVRGDDRDADVLEITTRVNRQVEDVIRERPESWNWTLKRFKSRPTEERGSYPPYSRREGSNR